MLRFPVCSAKCDSPGFGRARSNERQGGGGAGLAILIAVALLILASVLAFLIRLALSRSREYLADAGSVELTENPDAMISALRKIENRGELPGATSALMEMCVDNPREGFGELFDTHPTVENRIAALVKYAGGHDPGPIAFGDAEDDGNALAGPDQPPAGPWSTDSTGSGPWGAAEGQADQPAADGEPRAAPGNQNTPSPPSSPPGPWGPHGSRP